MKIKLSTILGFLILLSMFPVNTHATSVDFTPNLVKHFKFSFVNFDEELVDTDTMINNLPKDFQYEYFTCNLQYTFDFVDQDFESEFNNYVDNITTQDTWTSKLNQSSLKSQVNDFRRTDIFDRQDGVSIDAAQMENYLNQHKRSDDSESLSYNIFLLNLTRLDINNGKHWFNVTEIDPDSGKQRFYWRLEWDYPLNYDVRFPYAAYAHDTDTAFIDVTSYQWYLAWRDIWNQDVQVHDSYYNTLQDLIKGKTNSESTNIVTDTLSTWIVDWIVYDYNMYVLPTDIGSTVDTNLEVVYNSSQSTPEELSWIINKQIIQEQIGKILKSDDVLVNVNLIDIEEDYIMQNFIESGRLEYSEYQPGVKPFANWTYYDGSKIHWGIAENEMIYQKYYDRDIQGTPLDGIILLLENASFAGEQSFVPWSGGMYTGLGGGGKVAILYELDRAFMPDKSHKSGLSKVIVHELGHAIGIPHTFYNRFIGDFSSDVMGYYPGTEEFSETTLQAYWAAIVLQKMQLLETVIEVNDVQQANQYKQKFEDVMEKFNLKKFLEAYDLLIPLLKDMDLYSSPTTSKNGFMNATLFILSPILLTIFYRRKREYSS